MLKESSLRYNVAHVAHTHPAAYPAHFNEGIVFALLSKCSLQISTQLTTHTDGGVAANELLTLSHAVNVCTNDAGLFIPVSHCQVPIYRSADHHVYAIVGISIEIPDEVDSEFDNTIVNDLCAHCAGNVVVEVENGSEKYEVTCAPLNHPARIIHRHDVLAAFKNPVIRNVALSGTTQAAIFIHVNLP